VKSCFFISRIGDPGSDEREHSNKLLEYIVGPVVQELGYDSPKRADQLTDPGTITIQVYRHLWESDLVVADLTGSNPNVFYELAVRHLSKRPFVHMVLRGEALPFDLAPERAVKFDFDIAANTKVKRILAEHIKSAENSPSGCRTALSDTVGTAELLAAVKGPIAAEKAVMETVVSILQDIQFAVRGAATIKSSYGLPALPHPAFPEGTVLFEQASRKFYFSDSGYGWSPLASAILPT
jgi:hypothetical protein